MANVNTETATPAELAILPDWSQQIEVQIQFATALQRSWAGRDQRQRKRDKPQRRQKYQHNGLTESEARARLLALKQESRQPVYTPFWSDGITIAVMGSASLLTLDVAPVEGEWDDIAKVYLWDETLGGEFRDVSSITGRNVSLGGTGTVYPLGAFVFPCPIQIREQDESGLQPINLLDGTETCIFRTL